MGRGRCELVILISFLTMFCLLGQSNNVGINYGTSKFIRHSNKSTFELPVSSYHWHAFFSYKVSGQNHWHRYWKKPTLSYNVLYFDLGNDDVLGKAFAIFPSMSFNLLSFHNTDVLFQFGTGLAYLNKKYDKIDNPTNNAIGSHLNNVTHLAFVIKQKIYKNLSIAAGTHFTHFSNSRTSSPNIGINMAGFSIGMIHRIDNKSTVSKMTDNLSDTLMLSHKWGMDFLIGYGISEFADAGGPKYGSYFVNSGVSYAISPFWKVISGGEYEYNQSVFQFYYQDFLSENDAKQKATKTALYLASDLTFGKVVFRAQSGYYLPFPSLSHNEVPFYFKINFNVYPFPIEWKVRPYFGVLIKSHLEVAQYMGLVSGVSF